MRLYSLALLRHGVIVVFWTLSYWLTFLGTVYSGVTVMVVMEEVCAYSYVMI